MLNRSFCLSLATGLALAMGVIGAPAKAGSVVLTDSGSAAGIANVTGTAGGATFGLPTTTSGAINLINGTSVTGITVGFASNITGYTPFMGIDVITAGTATKIISDGSGDTAVLEITINGGSAMVGSLTVTGVITSVTGTGDTNVGGYNFTSLVGGMVSATDTLSGFNFAPLLGNNGATSTTGNFTVSQNAAVPEPTSMALLGIGITGFLAFRRRSKRALAQ